MATKLNGSIALNLIPKNRIFTHEANNGVTYKTCYIDVTPLKEPDEKGNTHSVSIYDSEARKAVYLGRLKPQEFGEKQTTPAVAPVSGGYKEEDGDLPF